MDIREVELEQDVQHLVRAGWVDVGQIPFGTRGVGAFRWLETLLDEMTEDDALFMELDDDSVLSKIRSKIWRIGSSREGYRFSTYVKDKGRGDDGRILYVKLVKEME